MAKIGRYKLSEISIARLLYAISIRFSEMPHTAAWYLQSCARENRTRLMRYKGIHDGERCFIVANGPSLQITDLDLLDNEVTFGLNRIYLMFNSTKFRPRYYVAANELILEQFAAEIMHLNMPKFLNWNRRSFFDAADPSLVFLKSKLVVNDFFQPNVVKPMVIGATVTFVALQLAYYMGFKKVILIGLDHNYLEKGIPSKTETRKSEVDQSHFHKDYFPKGIKWQLPDLLRSEIDFTISREFYESEGREIVDATPGGKCQVFKKADYLSLF